MALEGIAQQQNAFNMGLGNIMSNRKNQEAEMRRLAVANFTAMMLQQYQRKHDEEVAARHRKQQMGFQIAAIGAMALTSGAAGSALPGLGELEESGQVYSPALYGEKTLSQGSGPYIPNMQF